MHAMPVTFDAASAVIFLSAIGLMAVVAAAVGAYAGRREDRTVRLGLPDHSRRRRAF
jgi:hypothetical protein